MKGNAKLFVIDSAITVAYNSVVLCGFLWAVFEKGASPWWMVLMVCLLYSPSRALLDEKEQPNNGACKTDV